MQNISVLGRLLSRATVSTGGYKIKRNQYYSQAARRVVYFAKPQVKQTFKQNRRKELAASRKRKLKQRR